MCVQPVGNLDKGACREPGIEQVAEPPGGPVPRTLVGEVHAQFVGEGGHLAAHSGHLQQAPPLLRGDRHDHHPPVIGRREVPPEGPVDGVADPTTDLAVDLGLRQVPQGSHGGQRHVGKGNGDLLALAGPIAVPIGGHQAERRHLPADQVPGRNDVVHRARIVRVACHGRITDRAVDRVVQRAGAVVRTRDDEHHQVLATGPQLVV